MGFVLLALFAISEIALVVLTFTRQREKAMWLRNRVIVRCAQAALFLLALLLPQAAQTSRFRLCFFILLLRMAVALLSFLIKRRRVSGEQSKPGAAVNAVLGILILALSLIPAFLFSGYQGLETTGPYEVAHTSAILIDKSRTETFETDGSFREVPAHFYYPKTQEAAGSGFPLVLFSHGAFGYYQSNTSTYMELASHGYLVVSLDHPYHSFFTEDTDGKRITVSPQFIQEIMSIQDEEAVAAEGLLELSRKWLGIRTADMNFVLDTIKEAKAAGSLSDAWFLSEASAGDEIMDVLAMTDTAKIGLMGHSLGGAASVAVGRQRDDISAVIDLDGTMLGERLGYENGSWQFNDEAYPVPLLSVDNEEHHQEGVTKGQLYVNTFVMDRALDGKYTYFIGSGHMNFTDLPLFSPPLASLLGTGDIDETECIKTMNAVILAYFDAYLKGDGDVTINESY